MSEMKLAGRAMSEDLAAAASVAEARHAQGVPFASAAAINRAFATTNKAGQR